jgi:hypothetical protein
MDNLDPRQLIDCLDRWVNTLAAPTMPPHVVVESGNHARLEFRMHIPHTVLVGKLVRIVSGIRAALTLADQGYVTECASILRIVSDFCTEVTIIAKALDKGDEIPKSVSNFVAQYFQPKSQTPEQYEKADRARYISRAELLNADQQLSANFDAKHPHFNRRSLRKFLNMVYDGYVHGAYETTMDLFDQSTGLFAMRGHPDIAKREEFVDAVYQKLPEVVVAIELTAAVTGTAAVFSAAREARRKMHVSKPWMLDKQKNRFE